MRNQPGLQARKSRLLGITSTAGHARQRHRQFQAVPVIQPARQGRRSRFLERRRGRVRIEMCRHLVPAAAGAARPGLPPARGHYGQGISDNQQRLRARRLEHLLRRARPMAVVRRPAGRPVRTDQRAPGRQSAEAAFRQRRRPGSASVSGASRPRLLGEFQARRREKAVCAPACAASILRQGVWRPFCGSRCRAGHLRLERAVTSRGSPLLVLEQAVGASRHGLSRRLAGSRRDPAGN